MHDSIMHILQQSELMLHNWVAYDHAHAVLYMGEI
jgi:hypothetical protein